MDTSVAGVSPGFELWPTPESVRGEAGRQVRHDSETVRFSGSSVVAGGTLHLNQHSVCQGYPQPIMGDRVNQPMTSTGIFLAVDH